MKKHYYYISGPYHLQLVAKDLHFNSMIEMPDYFRYHISFTTTDLVPTGVKTLKYIRLAPVHVFDTEYNFWFLEGTQYTIPVLMNDLIMDGIKSWESMSDAPIR